jgi:hypothetical protein
MMITRDHSPRILLERLCITRGIRSSTEPENATAQRRVREPGWEGETVNALTLSVGHVLLYPVLREYRGCGNGDDNYLGSDVEAPARNSTSYNLEHDNRK